MLYAQQEQRQRAPTPPTPPESADDEELWQRLYSDPFIAPDLKHFSERSNSTVAQEAGKLWGRMLYNYYNWRRDTWSDLQLFTAVNFAFVMLCVATKNTIVGMINSSLPVQLLTDQGTTSSEPSSGILGDLCVMPRASILIHANHPAGTASLL